MEAIIEDLKKLLCFENRKLIIPIILVVVFFLWIAMDAAAHEMARKKGSEIVDNSLEVLKLAIYNASLNGTDMNIEKSHMQAEEHAANIQKSNFESLSSNFLLGSTELVVNVFAVPYCLLYDTPSFSSNPFYHNSHLCIASKFDGEIRLQVFRLVCNARYFTSDVSNVSTYIGAKLSDPDMNVRRDFIYSEEGKDVFRFYETKCKADFSDLENPEKLNRKLALDSNYDKIKIVSSDGMHAVIVLFILFADGYIISSILIVAYNKYKEHIIIRKMKKVKK